MHDSLEQALSAYERMRVIRDFSGMAGLARHRFENIERYLGLLDREYFHAASEPVLFVIARIPLRLYCWLHAAAQSI